MTSMIPLRPHGRFARSKDGANIYTDAVGDPTKSALVFIHGVNFSTVVWDVVFNNPVYHDKFYMVRLSTLYHASKLAPLTCVLQVRYDMRGFGQSAKFDDKDSYTSELFAADFAAVSAEYKLKKPVVVGWYASNSLPLPNISTDNIASAGVWVVSSSSHSKSSRRLTRSFSSHGF